MLFAKTGAFASQYGRLAVDHDWLLDALVETCCRQRGNSPDHVETSSFETEKRRNRSDSDNEKSDMIQRR